MNVIQLKSRVGLAFSLLILLSAQLVAQTPAKEQAKSILILNATAHLGNGEVIPNSAIGFENGKINMVLSAVDIKMDSTKFDTVIHCKGQHVYPGFIAPNSRLGLVEIGAVRATRDANDVGNFKPHVRSLIAYNTESKITPTVRTNGVLLAEVAPVGGRISGTSSLMELDGWNWQDAVLKEDIGMHLNWPRIHSTLGADAKKDKKTEKQYSQQITELRNFLLQAKAYSATSFHLETNLRFEAMKDVFAKKRKVFIHANRVQEITDAIYFFDEFELDLVLVGGYDAWMVASLLKDRDIPIILRRVHSLPMNSDDDVDLPYKLPKILSDKGLLICLENSGSMEEMGTRNLPFYAGTAAAYGLEKEEALQLITLNTAKILGVESRIGSIEVGKDATLFVSEGDALDMRTNQLTVAFIQGKMLELTNHQIQLYKKYSKKYKEQ